jgi:hypothetical protein
MPVEYSEFKGNKMIQLFSEQDSEKNIRLCLEKVKQN